MTMYEQYGTPTTQSDSTTHPWQKIWSVVLSGPNACRRGNGHTAFGQEFLGTFFWWIGGGHRLMTSCSTSEVPAKFFATAQQPAKAQKHQQSVHGGHKVMGIGTGVDI